MLHGPSTTDARLNQDVSQLPSALEEGRIRFLRACDRCRKRKMKCDSANPCGKCATAGLQCTFDSAPSSTLLHGIEQEAEASSAPHLPAAKRRRTSSSTGMETSLARTHPVMVNGIYGHSDTSHFYTSKDGLPRFAGNTSGLPLLDAVRRHIKQREGTKPMDFSAEPDWNWLSTLLQNPRGLDPSPRDQYGGDEEEVEYFPGREVVPPEAEQDISSVISEIIPLDLITTLVHTFFDVIHPKWPIIHKPTFISNLHIWTDPAYAALVVSMCMLASRYTSDVRVRSDRGNPTSAGVKYFTLFRQLRDQAVSRDHVVYSVQSLFFASLFHCVDNVPHPIAQSLVAEATVRCLDAGLHRDPCCFPDESPILHEMRIRTVWACYVWDKQISTLCGRPAILKINDYEVSLPSKFQEASVPTAFEPLSEEDENHSTVFTQLILVSAILEKTIKSCNHPPLFDHPFLNKISASILPLSADTTELKEVESLIDEWRKGLPPQLSDRSQKGRTASAYYSVQAEYLAATELIVELLVSGRKLQLGMLSSGASPTANTSERFKLEDSRSMVLTASKDLLGLAVGLGAADLLRNADIFMPYCLLVAGRMLLAVLLSARADGDHKQLSEAETACQAVAVLLRHLSKLLPISLGSSEVFQETCRVCRVNISSNDNGDVHRPRYAWYRPISYISKRPTTMHGERAQSLPLGNPQIQSNIDIGPPQESPLLDFLNSAGDINLGSTSADDQFFTSAMMPHNEMDYAWMLLENSSNIPFGMYPTGDLGG